MLTDLTVPVNVGAPVNPGIICKQLAVISVPVACCFAVLGSVFLHAHNTRLVYAWLLCQHVVLLWSSLPVQDSGSHVIVYLLLGAFAMVTVSLLGLGGIAQDALILLRYRRQV